jgi:hypothetical protein
LSVAGFALAPLTAWVPWLIADWDRDARGFAVRLKKTLQFVEYFPDAVCQFVNQAALFLLCHNRFILTICWYSAHPNETKTPQTSEYGEGRNCCLVVWT